MKPLPEYLELFSDDGPFTVCVKFLRSGQSVRSFRMCAQELSKLVSADGTSYLKSMTIDEWPHEITRIEIDLAKQGITLHVDQLLQSSGSR